MTGSFSGQVMTILSFFAGQAGLCLDFSAVVQTGGKCGEKKKAISDQSGWLEMAYGWKDKVSLSFHTAYV